mmetsp:Transcript_2912/g.9073  ORF Transcript_2912/g.9073 Transcript_2912/m.9073 type:complete len:201 (-) Transcript_2912:2980-3582(-)
MHYCCCCHPTARSDWHRQRLLGPSAQQVAHNPLASAQPPNCAFLRQTANCSASPMMVRTNLRLSPFSILSCWISRCCSDSPRASPRGLGSERSAAGSPALTANSNGPVSNVLRTSAVQGTTSPLAGPFGAAAASNRARAQTILCRAGPRGNGRSATRTCACFCNSCNSGAESPLHVSGSAQRRIFLMNLIMAQTVRSCTA